VPRFQRQQLAKQFARRERSVEHRYSVDEIRLVRLARGRRAIQRRVPDQTRVWQLGKLTNALVHLAHWIRQIGPEPDMRNLKR